MADMIDKGHWIVMPLSAAKGLPHLRLSPIGVVPQHERRPRTIVDYSFYGVNDETQPVAPLDSMQFGRALERLIRHIVTADPKHGPVKLIKVDLADGFYRVWLEVADIPKLGVIFPHAPGEEPLVALPLALPMGWVNSPPIFCAATETIADIANARIRRHEHPRLHRLDEIANSSPPTESIPDVAGPSSLGGSSNLWPIPVPVPTELDPNLMPGSRQALAAIDIYVDDFCGAAQGSDRRLQRIRRILLDSIDDVFRPLQPNDNRHRQEPSSVKKLRKGDACWSTIKQVLGWVIDTQAMTISLPQRRYARLHELLSNYPRNRTKVPLAEWHKTLGELRSMSLALPGTRGLFSLLQEAFRHPAADGRIRLNAAVLEIFTDLREVLHTLAQRPTRLYELVPLQPTLVGSHDAAGHGAGGVWFPSSTAVPRAIKLRGQPGQHKSPCSPIVWRMPFPMHVTNDLSSFKNPKGPITNSDLELLGSVMHHEAAAQCFDVRERTVKSSTDNTPTLFWERKGSTTTTGPAAYLLRIQALHQRHHRYVKLHDFLEGKRNLMADDASRLQSLSNQEFLTHFNSVYPQEQSWRLWTPSHEMSSSLIGSLHKKRPLPASFLLEPKPPIAIGHTGASFASLWPSTPYSPISKTPSFSSKSICTDTALEKLLPKVDQSVLARWKIPYGVLAKRSHIWGPRTHATHPKAKWISASNVR